MKPRAAFSAMLRDKEFLDDAAKQKMEIVDPMDGATLQATVARLLATDTGVVAAVRRAVGGEAGARRALEGTKAQTEQARFQLEAAQLALTSNVIVAAVQFLLGLSFVIVVRALDNKPFDVPVTASNARRTRPRYGHVHCRQRARRHVRPFPVGARDPVQQLALRAGSAGYSSASAWS